MDPDTKEFAEDTRLNDNQNPYKEGSSINDAKKAEQQSTFDSMADKENYSKDGKSGDLSGGVKKAEENGGTWTTNLSKTALNTALKSPRIKKSGVAWLLGGGSVGVVSMIFLVMALLIPMKLQGFISNIMTSATEVPQHAVEQRVEYLVTRALASRLIASADKSIDADLVFCKSGGISCSLFKTYTTKYFEDKLGITIDVDTDGRTSLGGNARSWNVAIDPADIKNPNSPYYAKPTGTSGLITIDEVGVEKARAKIDNSSMKKLIKTEVTEKTSRHAYITRALGRKILREKYGVRLFSGPKWVENSRDKLITVRSNLKASITKNTIGKISPRFATYMTCLSDPTACDSLKEGIKADIANSDPTKQADWDKLSDEEKARKLKNYEVKKSLAIDIEAGGYSEDSATALKKIFSKNMMKALGVTAGATAAISVVDLIFKMIEAIDNGGPEAIGYDIVTQAYTGFSTEIVTDVQKVIAGDMDMETLNAVTELFEDAEQSPLYQAENYSSPLNGTVSAASNRYVTSCKGSDGEEVQTVLEEGELVCPEEYAVHNYSAQIADNPVFSGLGDAAKAWNNTAGVAVDFVNGLIGNVMSAIPGFNAAMEKVGTGIAPLIEKVVSMIFDIPAIGPGELGSHNYAALSGGLRVTQNALMEQGVDSEGRAMGGGGTVLTDDQLAVIHSETINEADSEYANKSLADKIFDTSTPRSFMSQFVAKIPLKFSSLASLPLNSILGAMNSSLTANAAKSSVSLNPFHLPIYGYASGSSELTASPDTYTAESCAASAKAREESYKRVEGDLISTYTVSDPCALEKMVVGSELAIQGVEGDEYSFQSIQDIPVGELSDAATTSTSATAVGSLNQDSTSVACAPGTIDKGNQDGYKNGVKIPIKLCAIPGTYGYADSSYGNLIVVNSRVSGAALAMINKLKSDLGLSVVNFTSSFRKNTVQASLYKSYVSGSGNVAAKPGYSNHQLGTAFDVKFAPDIPNSSSYCKGAITSTVCQPPKPSKIYSWLSENASNYGFSQLYSEYWHWEYK